MRFPPDFMAAYEVSSGGRNANVRLRHPDPPPDAERSAWHFRAAEMDTAGHINNSHYWVPLEERLAAGSEPESIDVEVEYRDPAVAGEAVLLVHGSSMWIASPEGALNASLLIA
jgi:acyl-ACP thioesterase